MRREDLQRPARLRDAMEFRHKSDYVRNVFDHMPANDLFKLVICEGIRKDAEIVNDVGMTTRVGVDTDGAGKFILATTYVQNSLRAFGHALSFSATANWRTGPN